MNPETDPLDTLDDAVAAQAFRRLIRHLRHREDAQNVDLMGLAGFCRNCLSDWVEEAGGLDKDAARETVYGMPYAQWKAEHQGEASPEQLAKMAESVAKKQGAERELAEGPEAPDQILECRKFAGKEADYVIVSSRRKEGWSLATTVVAGSLRLRIGDPLEKTLEGRLRTCYPLRVIRDLQVDRRIVPYDWPKDAPPLPDLEAELEE